MRESIGATWIFGIVIVFIVLFSGYLALSINYSRAFRIKDGIVERLEKYSGVNGCSVSSIKSMMNEIGYSSRANCNFLLDTNEDADLEYIGVTQDIVKVCKNKSDCINDKFNYCILKNNANTSGGDSIYQYGNNYYKIYAFFNISLPVFNMSSLFSVSGETSVLVFPDDSCFNNSGTSCGGCVK